MRMPTRGRLRQPLPASSSIRRRARCSDMATTSRRKEHFMVMHSLMASLVLLLAVTDGVARADSTCNGFIHLNYPSAPPVQNVGDVVQVKITFGAGTILGGLKLLFSGFKFDLDCNPLDPLVPHCTDDGAVVSYQGDSTITTDCLGGSISWTSNNPGGGTNPNVLEFTPSVTFGVLA